MVLTSSPNDQFRNHSQKPLWQAVDSSTTDRGWVDLPVYGPVWRLLNQWLDEPSALPQSPGRWLIDADSGCGKTLLCNELRQRNRFRRIKLYHAEFLPGQVATANQLIQKWSKFINKDVELPNWLISQDKLSIWLNLACQCLSRQGYCVRLVVEADRLDRETMELVIQKQALFLRRTPFRGLSASEAPVLPPWSEGDTTEVIHQKKFGLNLEPDDITRLWAKSRGFPRETIALLQAGAF